MCRSRESILKVRWASSRSLLLLQQEGKHVGVLGCVVKATALASSLASAAHINEVN